MSKPKPTAKPAKMQPPSALTRLEGKAKTVSFYHEAIAALPKALDEIEYQYASFSTETVRDYARAAIVDSVVQWSKRQRGNLCDLFLEIGALKTKPAPAGGSR